MKSMLEMQGTLFLLILVGIYAQKKGIITNLNRKKFTNLIIEVILPCNIVNSFLIDWSYDILNNCITVFSVAIIAQIMYVILSKMLFKKSEKDKQAVLRYAIICSNAGFLGNPIVESVFGTQGLLFASVALIPLRFAMWSSGLKLFTATDGKSTAKKLITHPCIIAVFVGFALMLSQIQLPSFMLKTLSGIGSSNTAITVLVILKLLGINHLAIGVIVLLPAMPAGSTTVMLAEKYDGNSRFASSCVFLSTVLSLITIPLISLFLI